MNYLEKVRACSRSELPELARAITDDRAAFPNVIVGLARGGNIHDHMRLAEVMSFAAIDGTSDGEIYRKGKSSAGRRYVDMFLSFCKACGYPESEYVGVFINAIHAPKNSALHGWSVIADEYLTKRAHEDFDLVATYIDCFDKTYSCYSVLLRADRPRALGMLLHKALYGRSVNKTAVRSILVNCPDITDALISAYDGMNAKERAAIVRLLLPHKSDIAVEKFLTERAAHDKSKTVLDELKRSSARNANKSGGAVKYFESLMSTGETVMFGALCELVGLNGNARSDGGKKSKHSNYGKVAEDIFFYTIDKDDFDAMRVICFDGKKFFDMNDGQKIKLPPEAEVGVLHPLDLQAGDPLLKLDISQPFPQLRRATFEPLTGERQCSKRFFGMFLSGNEFNERVKRFGFTVCDGADGKPVALRISGRYAVGVEYDGRTFMCDKIYYYRASDIVTHGRRLFLPQMPLDISELDGKTYSELTYFAARLFANI